MKRGAVILIVLLVAVAIVATILFFIRVPSSGIEEARSTISDSCRTASDEYLAFTIANQNNDLAACPNSPVLGIICKAKISEDASLCDFADPAAIDTCLAVTVGDACESDDRLCNSFVSKADCADYGPSAMCDAYWDENPNYFESGQAERDCFDTVTVDLEKEISELEECQRARDVEECMMSPDFMPAFLMDASQE